MHSFIADLFPICRSITSEGVWERADVSAAGFPSMCRKSPRSPVLDWTASREWNIRDAKVADASGRRIIDFRESNFHVVSYSVPFRGRLDLDQLREHTYTVPDHSEWIPYRTPYYVESWGLCLSQRQLEALPEGEYDVCIDTSLRDGHLTYAECYLPGSTEDEFLFSRHICHPSLANDNLSGVAVSTFLAERLARVDHHYSYRSTHRRERAVLVAKGAAVGGDGSWK